MNITLPVTYTKHKEVDIPSDTLILHLRRHLLDGYRIVDGNLVEYGKISYKDYSWIPVRAATPSELQIDAALTILETHLS